MAFETVEIRFKKTAGLKIANPEVVIATLTDNKAEFELEVWVERGRGYLPTEMMVDKKRELGIINIDAIFTPIKKVAVDTKNVRVGEMTNWDQLILEIETDGTITCQEALEKSAKILVEQFSFLLNKKSDQESRFSGISDQETETKSTKKKGRPKKKE